MVSSTKRDTVFFVLLLLLMSISICLVSSIIALITSIYYGLIVASAIGARELLSGTITVK